MNDIYSVITGLSLNAYEIAVVLALISLVGRLIFRGLNGKSPI